MEKMREDFLSVLSTLAKQDPDRLLFTKSKYDKLIDKVKGTKLKEKKTPQDYQRLFAYDVVIENGIEKLTTPPGAGNKYFAYNEEMFGIIDSVHTTVGHGSRARVLKILKKKYRNISKDIVDNFFKLCPSCKTMKKDNQETNMPVPRNAREFDTDSDSNISGLDQSKKPSLPSTVNLDQPKREHILVKWAPFYSNMRAVFCSLLNNEHFVDVTLACEKKSIKCHKVILSACSPYFADLLTNNPCQHPIILMKDVRFWELESLIEFIYNGEVQVPEDKLYSFLKVAEALQIQGLIDEDASSESSASSNEGDSTSGSEEDNSSSSSSADDEPLIKRKRNIRKRKREHPVGSQESSQTKNTPQPKKTVSKLDETPQITHTSSTGSVDVFHLHISKVEESPSEQPTSKKYKPNTEPDENKVKTIDVINPEQKNNDKDDEKNTLHSKSLAIASSFITRGNPGGSLQREKDYSTPKRSSIDSIRPTRSSSRKKTKTSKDSTSDSNGN